MIINSIFTGKARGSAGGFIAQTYNGKTYFHSKPRVYHYPDTPAQQAAQQTYWYWQRQANYFYRIFKDIYANKRLLARSLYGIYTHQLINTANIFNHPRHNTPRTFIGPIWRERKKITASNIDIDIDTEFFIVTCSFTFSWDFDIEQHHNIFLLAIDKREKGLALVNSVRYADKYTFTIYDPNAFREAANVLFYFCVQTESMSTNFQICKQTI